MCAESLNMLLNGAGESVELLKRGIDLLDENWPCELTFTGGGVRADLQAFEAVSATNPMLFAEIFAAVPEVLCYFQGVCSEREKLQCLTSFISKARVSGKNLIYDLDNNTKLIFRRDIGPDAHSIRPKYHDKVNHYNIEIQKYSQKNHGFQKWRDYHIILDQNNNVIDYFEQS